MKSSINSCDFLYPALQQIQILLLTYPLSLKISKDCFNSPSVVAVYSILTVMTPLCPRKPVESACMMRRLTETESGKLLIKKNNLRNLPPILSGGKMNRNVKKFTTFMGIILHYMSTKQSEQSR